MSSTKVDDRQLDLSNVDQAVKFTHTAGLRVENVAPALVLRETDQTLADGLWRVLSNNNSVIIQKNTALAGDFSTSHDTLTVQNTQVVIDGVLATSHSLGGGTPGGIRFVSGILVSDAPAPNLFRASADERLHYKDSTPVDHTLAYTSDNLGVFAATTSAQLAGVISDETGSGALVFGTSPMLITPTLGVATATSVNKLTITTPTTSATLTIADGKTLTVNQNFPVDVVTLTDGATPALDASLGNVFLLTAAGDRTIAVPTNPTSGQKIVIAHKASGANRTLSLNSGAGGFRFGTDVTALTMTTSGKTDYVGCIYNNADNKWDVVAYVKGY